MTQTYAERNEALKRLLEQLSQEDDEYWSFRGNAVREYCHAYSQYPAMMVPQMQGQLLKTISSVEPAYRSVRDSYMGSGTIETEAMKLGLDFTGGDINPLAVLLCRAKSGPFHVDQLCESSDALLPASWPIRATSIDVNFKGIKKWFRDDVAIELSRIRRAIQAEDNQWLRQFYWVALAETVRLSSNSRTSTFKLHIRPAEEVKGRAVSPVALFADHVRQNREQFCAQAHLLTEKGFLEGGVYKGVVNVHLADACDTAFAAMHKQKHDGLATSPPYGDNVTTVPYGQYSFLPLQWIDHADIDADMDDTYLATTHEIDSRSLGGSRKNAIKDTERLNDTSPSFKATIEALKDKPADRRTRVAAFCRDFDRSLDPILTTLKPGAVMVWTVGNRKVGGRPVPIDAILPELLVGRGAKEIVRLHRKIPNKRMAVKNGITETMRAETILVLRKGDD